MLLALLVIGASLAGHAISRSLWLGEASRGSPGRPPGPFEQAGSSIVVSLALWVAVNWILASTLTLTRTSLLVASLFLGASGAAALWRMRKTALPPLDRPQLPRLPLWFAALLLAPLACWVSFILWRGWLLPVLNHDALAYHLPKAILMVREAGYRFFWAPDFRIPSFPSNYELLLADFLILDGSDQLTEWVSTASYLLFVILAAALSERWWGWGPHLLGPVLLAAGVPVALLHSGAHKNDLLAAAFFIAAILWTCRWATHGGRAPLALGIVSVAAAMGTKQLGFFLAAVLAVMVVWVTLKRWRTGRGPSWLHCAAVVGFSLLAFVLEGGVAYLVNFGATGSISGLPSGEPTYGDWHHFWMVPYMLLAVPFSSQAQGVWAPWDGRYWLWPHYEVFTSHYGMLFTVLVLALPLAIWRYRGEGAARERSLGSLLAFVTVALILPVYATRPIGFFNRSPRYLLFAVAFVGGVTVIPLLRELFSRPRRGAVLGGAALLALSAIFSVQAIVFGSRDGFAPLSYLAWMMDHPGTREIAFRPIRAANVLDRLAGPEDHVAIDGGFDTWSYPAFGREMQRRVTFLDSKAPAVQIPNDADWVVIDRSWTCIFGHPGFKNFGQTSEFIFRGRPTQDDMRVFNHLRSDSRFELVYRDERINQAVFRRAPAAASSPDRKSAQ